MSSYENDGMRIGESVIAGAINSFRGNHTSEVLAFHRPCPICDSTKARTVVQLDDFQFFSDSDTLPKRFDISQQQCRDCMALYMNPTYSSYGFSVLFAQAGRSYGSSGRSFKEQIAWLTDHDLLAPGSILLDVGCFEGGFLSLLPKSIGRIGIDIDEPAIERGRAKYGQDGVRFICGDFEKFHSDEKPDTITMFHLLEHLPNPVGVLNQIRLNSKSETRLVVEVPILEEANVGDICGFFSPQHLTHFSKNSLTNCLKKAGWTIVRETYAQRYNGYRVVARPQLPEAEVASRPLDNLSLCKTLAGWQLALAAVEDKIKGCSSGEGLVIWGGGMHLEMLYQTTSFFAHNRKCSVVVVDSDPLKQGTSWRGVPIYSPKVLSGFEWSATRLLISSYGDQEEIKKAALDLGVPERCIVTLYDEVHSY